MTTDVLQQLLSSVNLQDPFARAQAAQMLAATGAQPPGVGPQPTNAQAALRPVGAGTTPEGSAGVPLATLGSLIQPRATPAVTQEQFAALPPGASSLTPALQTALAAQDPSQRPPSIDTALARKNPNMIGLPGNFNFGRFMTGYGGF